MQTQEYRHGRHQDFFSPSAKGSLTNTMLFPGLQSYITRESEGAVLTAQLTVVVEQLQITLVLPHVYRLRIFLIKIKKKNYIA